MRPFVALGLFFGLAACVANQHAANRYCAGTAGCVSSFFDTGYGPVHAQAVAPDSPSPLQPRH